VITKPLGESNTVIRLRTSLENVRSYLVDLEAVAHAARETLDRLPYMPRPSGSEGQELEVRLNYGRLQTLVSATATSARDVLLACDQMLEESHEPPDDNGAGGNGDDGNGDGGPYEPPGFSGNGECDGSAPEHLAPARQDIGEADERREEPPRCSRISDAATLSQGQHGVVEVSLDDIDDGPGKPRGLTSGGVAGARSMRRTRPSRGGIMLDVAAGPPEPVLLVSDGSAHAALQPTTAA
jgi:hypothetical protein